MNILFKHIRSDKILFIACLATLFLLFVTILISIILYQYLPPFIPLFNQMPWGVARLGAKDQIFIPIFIGFITLLCNGFFISMIYEQNPLIARMLGMTALLTSLFIFLFTIRAIQIII